MDRLSGISGQRFTAALGRAGYEVVRHRGSHVIVGKSGQPNLVIPGHREVAPFLLRSQIRRAGLTEDELISLL
jgi:predicted RNA binding protein YcfA (HicA-like mRNA interferase family)